MININIILYINTKYTYKYQGHPFHMVDPSAWPIIMSGSLYMLTSSSALAMNVFENSNITYFLSLMLVMYTMFLWFKDIVAEATHQGHHTLVVQKGINIGVALFIISEIFFFLSIFWAYFHNAISPDINIGSEWPPLGIQAINPFELPLLNTIILLSSGIVVTYAHHSVIKGNRGDSLKALLFTIVLAIIFTMFQSVEYTVSSFTISDGIYGSCFYFGTGFHGLHVIIGTIFLFVSLIRILFYHITDNHHLGLESGILYWHFVDIVWIFLYVFIYYWGS